jgi:hypothetical protein
MLAHKKERERVRQLRGEHNRLLIIDSSSSSVESKRAEKRVNCLKQQPLEEERMKERFCFKEQQKAYTQEDARRIRRKCAHLGN